jgi:rubrerythrin
MSIALTLFVLVFATVVFVRIKKKRAERHSSAQVFYVCRQCEHPYVMPNVPLRCRRCDGPVEKTFEN